MNSHILHFVDFIYISDTEFLQMNIYIDESAFALELLLGIVDFIFVKR